MRRRITPVLLAAALLAAGGAAAQDKPASDQTVASSPMIKVKFEVQPIALEDDGSYATFMDQIASDNGRRCGKYESYGWTFPAGDQSALDKIVQPTMTGMEKNGYTVNKANAASAAVPNVAAFAGKKDKQNVLAVWVPAKDAVLLLLCQMEANKNKPAKK
jgi:hypothetical protein